MEHTYELAFHNNWEVIFSPSFLSLNDVWASSEDTCFYSNYKLKKKLRKYQEGHIASYTHCFPRFFKEGLFQSSTLAWNIPWTEKPGRLQSMGSRRVRHDWATSLHFSLSCIGERNGYPLQCCCLENPRDGGAWWAAVYGVAQSRTRLKHLSSSSSSSNTGHQLFYESWC